MRRETLDFVIKTVENEDEKWVVKVSKKFLTSQKRFQREIQSHEDLESRRFSYLPDLNLDMKN